MLRSLAMLTFIGSAAAAEGEAPQRDGDYVQALGTVNRFLGCWAMREQERGLAFVSPALRERVGDEAVRRWLSGPSNPHHEAFEIGEGERQAEDRFVFPVRLHEQYTNTSTPTPPRGRTERIVVTRVRLVSFNYWRVDALPASTPAEKPR